MGVARKQEGHRHQNTTANGKKPRRKSTDFTIQSFKKMKYQEFTVKGLKNKVASIGEFWRFRVSRLSVERMC